MKLSKNVLIALFLFSVPQLSFATAPSFSYVEFEYIASGTFNVSRGGASLDVDISGYSLNISAELGRLFFQASRYELESDTIFNSSLKDNISSLAVGISKSFQHAKLYGLARVRRDELSLTRRGIDEDENGHSLGFEAGVRYNLTDRLELNASVGKPDISEGSSHSYGAQFYITKDWGLTFKYSKTDINVDDIDADFETSSIGLRYHF